MVTETEIEEVHVARNGQLAIAHLSFVDERQVVLHEMLLADDFEWNVGELWTIQERDFVVMEVFVQYVDENGAEIERLEDGKNDECSTLLVFVTCERVAIDSMSDARAIVRASDVSSDSES